MTAFYNEIDSKKAAWLRELIKANAIAPGIVDERSIEDIRPDELHQYTQCHFFAGCGIWSYALRLAGWPDNRRVWTFSCPCQPFSAAGKGAGFSDERHLWPAMFHLIQHGKSPEIPAFAEQVASSDGLAWLDLVYADLEAAGHACWPFDLCAAGFGAPHIRQRLYIAIENVAHATGDRCQREWQGGPAEKGREPQPGFNGQLPNGFEGFGIAGGLANATKEGCGIARSEASNGYPEIITYTGQPGGNGKLADLQPAGLQRHGGHGGNRNEPGRHVTQPDRPITAQSTISGAIPGPVNGFWQDADWLFCRDGKWRPVEPGAFPLVNGASARVVRLRGYGDGIVAQQAANFIRQAQKIMQMPEI